jgi:hypothetical protein
LDRYWRKGTKLRMTICYIFYWLNRLEFIVSFWTFGIPRRKQIDFRRLLYLRLLDCIIVGRTC